MVSQSPFARVLILMSVSSLLMLSQSAVGQGAPSQQTIEQQFKQVLHQNAVRSCRQYTRLIHERASGKELERQLDIALSEGNDNASIDTTTAMKNKRKAMSRLRNRSPFAGMDSPLGQFLNSAYKDLLEQYGHGRRPNLDEFLNQCINRFPELARSGSSAQGRSPSSHSSRADRSNRSHTSDSSSSESEKGSVTGSFESLR